MKIFCVSVTKIKYFRISEFMNECLQFESVHSSDHNFVLTAHFHNVNQGSYLHIWSKYCRSSQREKHGIQEQSSNTEV